MKKYKSISSYFCIFFIFLFYSVYCFSVVKPPILKSDIGYLQVKKDFTVKLHKDIIFLVPKERLLLLEENDEFFIVSTLNPSENFLCRIPKYARYTLWLDRFDDNEISFRTGIEADTYPLSLKKGLELPVKEILDNGYLVYKKLKGEVLPFYVSGNKDEIVFKKRSRFDVFEAKQNKKGLKFFEGKWIPKQQVRKILAERKKQKQKNLELQKYLKTLSNLGIIVLKNGDILRGKGKGIATDYILFEKDSGDVVTVHLNEIIVLPADRVKMRAAIYDADKLFTKAKKLLADDIGFAYKNAENALNKLTSIPDDASFEALQAKKIKDDITDFMKSINDKLAAEGKVLYEYTVFPKEVLKYHLNKKHILVKRKYWIDKNQICPDCHLKGYVTCSMCRGKGKIVENCPDCNGTGKVACEICDGTGWKTCPVCRGKGFFEKKVLRGGYSFYGTSAYYPVGWRPATIVTNGNKMGIVGPSPIFERFDNGSSIDINGGNDSDYVRETCWRCDGKGVIKCPKTQKCTKCNGSGLILVICPQCHGKKVEKCKTCKGFGFIGKTKKAPRMDAD